MCSLATVTPPRSRSQLGWRSVSWHLSLCLQTFQVLLLHLLPIIPVRDCRLLGWGPNILLGVEANIRILQPPHLVSMAIRHMCASVTIQCRRIPAWCPTCRILTCLLASWLHWSK